MRRKSELVKHLLDRKITVLPWSAFAYFARPAMDALSSQSALAGYYAVALA